MRNVLNDDILKEGVEQLRSSFQTATPFNYMVIDNFFKKEVAEVLAREMLESTPSWHQYENAIEVKKTCNNWNEFPKQTYQVFSLLVSDPFVAFLREVTGCPELMPDVGLHGGGWHRHGRGGKLNTHLDYSIHPKIGMQRKLNLIVYMTKDWDPKWGGGLGLWSHDAENNKPQKIEKVVDSLFNRGVLFDTTQNSWHGLPDPIGCPEGKFRSSLAVYYMIPASEGVSQRERALFAPAENQVNDPAVIELIRKRSSSSTAADVYRTK